jgi:hypothetical protein
MISVAEAISDLLFVRDTVVVPGLGAFVKKPISAQVNTETNSFVMPSSVVEFDANLREDNDLVVRYLSEKNEVSEDEAKKSLVSFVSDCFNTLKTKKKVVLKGIGRLSFDLNDNLTFEQDKSVNYNSDSFGLSDFKLESVMRFKSKEEIKVEIEQQQRDKNTPVTVDERAVHEEDEYTPRNWAAWYWILLVVFVLVGVFFGLYHFDVIHFGKTENQTLTEDPSKPDVVQVVPQDSQPVTQQVTDSINAPTVLETSTNEVPATEYRVVAGCYDQEDNAVWFTNVLKDAGFKNAFYEKRGARWFVSFNHYATYEESLDALMDIRENTKYQAWVLVPQEQ